MITTAIESRPDLVLLLNGDAPVTALLPTNAAIAAVPNWADVAADDVAFTEFLRGHIVSGELTSVQVLETFELTTIGGQTLVIDRLAGTINGARFVTVDAHGTNGYVHTVDAPLVTVEATTTTTTATTATTTTTTAPAG